MVLCASRPRTLTEFLRGFRKHLKSQFAVQFVCTVKWRVTACLAASVSQRDRQTAFTLENDFGSVQGSYCCFGKSASQGPGQEGAENLPVISLQEIHEHKVVVREAGERSALLGTALRGSPFLTLSSPTTLVQG